MSLTKEQNENFTHAKINVVTVGNLDISFLDIDLLILLIKKFPHVTFHLVGSYSQNGLLFKTCKNLKNIVWWGRVESTLIPVILSECDVSLLLYKAENQYDKEQLASPHKIMEYLASGKVTIASYTDEYKDKPGLLEMVTDSEEYIPTFRKVVENIDYYNSPQKQQKRIDFAKDNTYQKQLERISQLIEDNNLGEL